MDGIFWRVVQEEVEEEEEELACYSVKLKVLSHEEIREVIKCCKNKTVGADEIIANLIKKKIAQLNYNCNISFGLQCLCLRICWINLCETKVRKTELFLQKKNLF